MPPRRASDPSRSTPWTDDALPEASRVAAFHRAPAGPGSAVRRPICQTSPQPMSGAPRTRRSTRSERPRLLRAVLRTVIASVVVLAAGFGAGLLIGRALL